MFVVHFHVKSTEPGGFDEAIRWVVWRLVEGKAHGTFALLFGAGFAILLRRAEARGQAFAPMYLRRLAVLAGFGFIAHAGFGYNVLIGYAVWGVPLLLIRRWPTWALLTVAVLSAVSVSLFGLVWTQYHVMTGGPEGLNAAQQAMRDARTAAYAALDAAESQGSYWTTVAGRLQHMAWFYRQRFVFMPGVTLALFISGFLFVRHRVFEDVGHHRRLLVGLAVFGVISWLSDNWLLEASGLTLPIYGLFRDQWLMFTYVSGALLLFAAKPHWLAHLRLVGNAGRMALTNYLLQIAFIDFVFAGWGLGPWKIRPLYGVLAAVACFLAEVAFSTAWLARFRMGPAEWVWRSLTLAARQPLRRITS